MCNKNYYSRSWSEFAVAWATIIGGFLGLVASGFVLKLLWNCFMLGWDLI